MKTDISSEFDGDTVAVNAMRVKRVVTSWEFSDSPVQELTYEAWAIIWRPDKSGVMRASPLGRITLTGSILQEE